jgi:hypothetical protein
MDKIFSATINDIGFIVQKVPDGLQSSGNTSGGDKTVISLKGDFFSQPIDFMKKSGDTWVKCDRDSKDPACKWVGIRPDEGIFDDSYKAPDEDIEHDRPAPGQPEDFYVGNNVSAEGKYYEQFYNVGAFTASGIAEKDKIFLQYTYFGKDILQRSIKALDFKSGIKARYTFKPGAKRLSGEFVAKINAEFLMVVEPF